MAPCSIEENIYWRNHSSSGLVISQPSWGSSPLVLLAPSDAERHNLNRKLILNIYYNFSSGRISSQIKKFVIRKHKITPRYYVSKA